MGFKSRLAHSKKRAVILRDYGSFLVFPDPIGIIFDFQNQSQNTKINQKIPKMLTKNANWIRAFLPAKQVSALWFPALPRPPPDAFRKNLTDV